MSSINQLVSEIAHSVQQAESVPVRRAIRQGIIHARNQLIRHSYSNHKYVDKVLKQRFNISIVDVPDGDIKAVVDPIDDMGVSQTIKRTICKVPRPVRVDNNTPFHSIKSLGGISPIIICYVSEGLVKYYKNLPGMCSSPTYDYINDYIYFYNLDDSVKKVSIESVFEYPHEIKLETSDKGEYIANIDDDDEFFIPEDMIGSLKELVLKTMNPEVVRNTNESATVNLVK